MFTLADSDIYMTMNRSTQQQLSEVSAREAQFFSPKSSDRVII